MTEELNQDLTLFLNKETKQYFIDIVKRYILKEITIKYMLREELEDNLIPEWYKLSMQLWTSMIFSNIDKENLFTLTVENAIECWRRFSEVLNKLYKNQEKPIIFWNPFCDIKIKEEWEENKISVYIQNYE